MAAQIFARHLPADQQMARENWDMVTHALPLFGLCTEMSEGVFVLV